jgi:UDP-N-acetylmuramoylalanine--D-glutamate ligase
MDRQGLFIYGRDCKNVQERVQRLVVVPETAAFTCAGLPESGNGAGMEGEELAARLDGREFRIHRDRISIRGRHNLYNAMAAVLASMRLGLSDEEIAAGLESFPQVEHRLESVAVKKGVAYINDSKATNVDSAWYALDSLTGPVVWIAGGTDKGNDYSVLEDLVAQKVKVLIAMGADNQKLVKAFSGICPVEDTHSLKEAMEQVRKYAAAGDTVLLSPCCASFDLFRNYEDRGRQFKEQVNQL